MAGDRVTEALEWLLRHAPVRAVRDLDTAGLLALLRRGPSDAGEEAVLVHVLNGDMARPQLSKLVEAEAVSGKQIAMLVYRLVAKGLLRKNGTYGHEPIAWREWADEFRTPTRGAHAAPDATPRRRGRQPLDPAKGALPDRERSKRYDQARRAEGQVRRTFWLSGEAARALDELVKEAGPEATNGSVAGHAILAWRAKQKRS